MFPTDRGMCCSFNKQRAEDMFNEGKYRDDKKMVPKLREFDSHLFIVMERFHATYSPSFSPPGTLSRSSRTVTRRPAFRVLKPRNGE